MRKSVGCLARLTKFIHCRNMTKRLIGCGYVGSRFSPCIAELASNGGFYLLLLVCTFALRSTAHRLSKDTE